MTLLNGTNHSGFDTELERLRKANENFSGDGFLLVVNRWFDLSGGLGVHKQDRKLNEKTLHWERVDEERMRGGGGESFSGSCNRLRQDRRCGRVNVTLWGVRVMFVPPRVLSEPGIF
jgi:hypothetical protein